MNKFTCKGCGRVIDIENSRNEDITLDKCPGCSVPSLSEWKDRLTETAERVISCEREYTDLLLAARGDYRGAGVSGVDALLFAVEKTAWIAKERRKIGAKLNGKL